MEKYKQIFDRNIDRVNSLCNLYKTIKTEESKEGKDYKFTDILRSAVVMLHSSFEEYYRIMKEHGITEFSFLYNDNSYRVIMQIIGLKITYILDDWETTTAFDNLDEFICAKFFVGKSLKESYLPIYLCTHPTNHPAY